MTFKKRTEKPAPMSANAICSCCSGEVKPLENISDELFPSMFVGDGFCIVPSNNKFVCPVSGEVKDVSENGFDVTIKTSDELIVIVSLGREENKPIEAEACVQRGDIVSVGNELWKTDINDGTLVCAVVVTNCNGKEFKINYGSVKQPGQPIMDISV